MGDSTLWALIDATQLEQQRCMALVQITGQLYIPSTRRNIAFATHGVGHPHDQDELIGVSNPLASPSLAIAFPSGTYAGVRGRKVRSKPPD